MISSLPHCHVCCKDCPIAARLETYPYFIPGIFSEIFLEYFIPWFHLGSVTLLEGFLQGFSDVTACPLWYLLFSYGGETRWMKFRSLHFILTRHRSGCLDDLHMYELLDQLNRRQKGVTLLCPFHQEGFINDPMPKWAMTIFMVVGIFSIPIVTLATSHGLHEIQNPGGSRELHSEP